MNMFDSSDLAPHGQSPKPAWLWVIDRMAFNLSRGTGVPFSSDGIDAVHLGPNHTGGDSQGPRICLLRTADAGVLGHRQSRRPTYQYSVYIPAHPLLHSDQLHYNYIFIQLFSRRSYPERLTVSTGTFPSSQVG